MRVLTVSNRKGGVGKTTTAACVAARLTELGARVLCLDLDGQPFNLSTIARADKGAPGMWDLLTDEELTAAAARECVQPAGAMGWVAAADGAIDAADKPLSERMCRERVVSDALALLDGEYDYAVVDTPPALGPRTVAALVAADDVVVPTTPTADGTGGVSGVLDALAKVRRAMGPARPRACELAGVVVVNWLRTNDAQERDAQLRRLCEERGVRVFPTRVRRTVRVPAAHGACDPVVTSDPDASASRDYVDLVDAYLALPGRDWREPGFVGADGAWRA